VAGAGAVLRAAGLRRPAWCLTLGADEEAGSGRGVALVLLAVVR